MFKFYACTPNGGRGFTVVARRLILIFGFGEHPGFDVVWGERVALSVGR